MSHDHNHKCQCKHDHLKYCARCFVVHCLDCKDEWATPCRMNHYNNWMTTYPTYYVGTPALGAGSSSSFTITNDDAHSLTCSH